MGLEVVQSFSIDLQARSRSLAGPLLNWANHRMEVPRSEEKWVHPVLVFDLD